MKSPNKKQKKYHENRKEPQKFPYLALFLLA
jgi:hypothetical protein